MSVTALERFENYARNVQPVFGHIENRASLESPLTSLTNPSAWLSEAFGLKATDSGVRVSEASAQRLSAWWACKRVLAETVACLPLITYQRLSRGKRHATDHPNFRLLHQRANSEMTSQTWRKTMMGHIVSWGNGYSEIERDRAGRPINLWPLLPDRTRAERVRLRDASGRIVLDGNGVPVIKRVVITHVPGANGEPQQEVVLPAENVLHVMGEGFDGIRGYSPVQMARQAIGLGLAAEEFGARWFGSGSRPDGVLEFPTKLSPDAKERIRSSWEIQHQGLSQSHRVAVLEYGMTWKPISVNPNDAQFLETKQAQVSEICRWHRMPPHMIQDLSRGTFSNIEIQSIEFVRFTMLPWFVNWEQEILRSLFTEAEQAEYFCEFLVEGLLRGAMKERYDAYAVGRLNGWLCADDIRELENMNPLPNDLGQIFTIPMSYIPLDQAANVGQKPEAPPPPAPADGETAPVETGDDADSDPALKARKLAIQARIDAFDARQRAIEAFRRVEVLGPGEPLPTPAPRNVTPVQEAPVEPDAVRRSLLAFKPAVPETCTLTTGALLDARTAGDPCAACTENRAVCKGRPLAGDEAPLTPASAEVEDRAAAELRDAKKLRQRRSAAMRNKHREAFLPAFRAAGKEIVTQMVKAVKSNLRRAMKRNQRANGEEARQISLSEFNSGMEDFVAGFGKTIHRHMRPVLDSFSTEVQGVIADELGPDAGAEDEEVAQQAAEEFIDGFVGRFTGSALGQLRAVISQALEDNEDDDGIEGAVTGRTDEWAASWPEKIANRESVRANGVISRATYTAAGVTTLVWVASGKPCDFCANLDGQSVSITETFADQGDELKGGEDDDPIVIRSGEGLPEPPMHDGCSCAISAG